VQRYGSKPVNYADDEKTSSCAQQGQVSTFAFGARRRPGPLSSEIPAGGSASVTYDVVTVRV
jgi:hypothetical protein